MDKRKEKIDEAVYLQNSGQWSSALNKWREITGACKNDLRANLQIGNCLIRLERYHDAEKIFLGLRDKITENPSALLGLATVYLRQGDLAQALELLFRIKYDFPENLNTLLLISQQFIKFRQYAIARQFAKQARKISPHHPQVLQVFKWLKVESESVYDQDGLWSRHNHDFMQDDNYIRSYQRGMQAAGGSDYKWHWRVHVGLWAAGSAFRLDGDFVECGVNRGFLSSAIMEHLDWNSHGKHFYLLDTFGGLDPNYVTEEEVNKGVLVRNLDKLERGSYTNDFMEVKNNFAEWDNVSIIQGTVPETLDQIESNRIAFLHLDMNSAEPERASLEFLWNRLVKGAYVLMDDYAYRGYEEQHKVLKQAIEQKGCEALSLPTGQGLLLKMSD